MARTYPRQMLSPGYVMLMRHRALNLRDAEGRATEECYDLLHQMLGPAQVLELINAWLRVNEEHGSKRERTRRSDVFETS